MPDAQFNRTWLPKRSGSTPYSSRKMLKHNGVKRRDQQQCHADVETLHRPGLAQQAAQGAAKQGPYTDATRPGNTPR
ncbi:MAG: hypothetical protein KA735_10635 [Burkholderiaceae bacterium]|nr:hypothetical protein [Burkholderiaceae bacterium]